MIKIKETRNGACVEVKGYKSEILAEFTTLVKGFIEKGTATKEEILECVNVATMNEEELDKAIQEKQEEFRKMVDEILQKAFDLTKGDDEDDNRGEEKIKEAKGKDRPVKTRKSKTKEDN